MTATEFRTDRRRAITYACDPDPIENADGRARGHVHCHGRRCSCLCHTAGTHLYAVQGVREISWRDGRGFPHSVSVQLPTIYLHPDVQGITGEEHAERIAGDIFRTWPAALASGVTETLHITALLVTIDPHTDKRPAVERAAPVYPWISR